MAIGTLTVTPEELQNASSVLAGYVRNMEACFSEVKRTMNASSTYWVGEAGDAHRALYESKVSETEEFIARCEEHIRDLNEMAGVYTEAENTAINEIEQLPLSNL